MQFFTAALHRRMQTDRFKQTDWAATVTSYQAHLDRIAPEIPASARKLARLNFHDCVLHRIELVAPERIILSIAGSKWSRRKTSVSGMHDLTFRKVARTNLAMSHLSRYWLYEEIHQAGKLAELRVLLDDHQQIYIQFSGVDVQSTIYPT